MVPDESRWVHRSFSLVLFALVNPPSQICDVLSVRESGLDWQVTQIGLPGCEMCRALGRVETCTLRLVSKNT